MSAPSASQELPQHRVAALVALPALIRQLGGDPAALCAEAGVALERFDAPDHWIPFAGLGRLLEITAARVGCEHVGLLAGRAFQLDNLGITGQFALNAPSVREAARLFMVYQHLNSEAAVAFISERDGIADLVWAVYAEHPPGLRYIYGAAMVAVYNCMRRLVGPDWAPLEATFAFSRPVDVEPYQRQFRTPLRFGAEATSFRFKASYLDRPVEGADRSRLRELQATAARAPAPIAQQVLRALRTLFASGSVSGNAVAAILMMHRRTLNRRLRDEGTTFQALLHAVRDDVARQLLAETDLAVDDIAAALGYSSASAFTRSFHAWSGTTPRHWRRNAQQRGPSAALS
ncbi:MAG: AraC family transcriptional regulator [Proteobacteria bacterium]|nr:AraC family transcriptional regulator [Pseudomonadota bacterium]